MKHFNHNQPTSNSRTLQTMKTLKTTPPSPPSEMYLDAVNRIYQFRGTNPLPSPTRPKPQKTPFSRDFFIYNDEKF